MRKVFTKKNIISFLCINLGLIFAAISVTFFLSPNNIAGGGLSGIAILIKGFLPSFLDISSFILICNCILLTIAFFLMGKEYFFKTAYSALMYPMYIKVLEILIKQLPNDFLDFSANMYLVVIFGALFMAVGVGITMKNGCSTGGCDIVQSIMFKHFNIPFSKTMYVIEGVLVILSLFVFKDITTTLLTVIYIILTGVILDNVVFGGYNKRAVYIISDKYIEIRDIILKDLVRGVTILNATGGYKNLEKPVILCVLSSKEYFELRSILEKIDPYAFTLVTKTSEVRGEGFSHESSARINARYEKRNKNKVGE